MRYFTILTVFILFCGLQSNAQVSSYQGGEFYPVQTYNVKFSDSKKPKNVILLIGNGMGLSHVYAGMTANGGRLFLNNFKHTGFSTTFSASGYITDPAAAGTALSCGVKTINGYIGMDTDKKTVVNIREVAAKMGKSTGIVSTSALTDATPAAFVAHKPNVNMYEEIAEDYVNSNIDVFIGGGLTHFINRHDNGNLADFLKGKGYQVLTDIEKIGKVSGGKLAGFVAYESAGRLSERGNMLPVSTNTAINILKNNKAGFFLVVESGHIDLGSHENDVNYVVEEMLDFDRTIAVALEFAVKNKETLVVVTGNHETGGFSVYNGDFKSGMVTGNFTTGMHTGDMVPVYAFGPAAGFFEGFMNNTDIPRLINKLMK